MKGKQVEGYRLEPNVNPQSIVPTYAAMKFEVNNWRWQGVPFYLRTGKRMPKKLAKLRSSFVTFHIYYFSLRQNRFRQIC